jgi:hypothetical protein
MFSSVFGVLLVTFALLLVVALIARITLGD